VRKKNAKKLATTIVTTAAVAVSAVVISNPAQAATTANAEKLVVKAEKLAGKLKWQVSYDYRKKAYPKKVLDYPDMKLFNETKSALKAAREEVKKLKGKEKEILEARLTKNVQVYVDRAIRYIDAVSAGKKIEAKANILKKLISNNIVNDTTETAYHDLSKEIRTKNHVFYKVYGASARKAFVETYVKPAQKVRETALYPISIKIEADRLNAKLKENKIDQVIYHKNRIEKFVSDGLRLGLLKENSNLFKSVMAYVNPFKTEFEKRFTVYNANSTSADKPTTFGGTQAQVKKYSQTVILIAGKNQYIKLANAEVNGNIIIKGNETGAGTVYLENVKVNKVNNQGGVIIVDDVADHSLHQKNVIAEELKINDANGANIVAEEGTKIKTLSLSETAGSTGAVILESKEKGAYEVVSVGTKGSESSKGVELKGDFSNTKVEVTGEGSQVKAAKNAVVKEIEVKTEAKLEAEQGAKVQAVNLAAEKAGQKIELKGDLKEATVTVKNANAQIEVAKDSVVKEIKKDSSVTEPIQVTNSGTIQTSTGVSVTNKDGGQTGSTGSSTGSGSSGSNPTAPLGKITVNAIDAQVTMDTDNKAISLSDNTFVIKNTKGTLKTTLVKNDVELTGLPPGLDYTVDKTEDGDIQITVTGTADTELTDDVTLIVVVKASAVTEAGAQDSNAVNLTLKQSQVAVTIDGLDEVSGQAIAGNQLTASYPSEWGGNVSVQWYRADDRNGTNKTKIRGATSINYTPTSDDVRKYISVEITLNNGDNSNKVYKSNFVNVSHYMLISLNVLDGGPKVIDAILATGNNLVYIVKSEKSDYQIGTQMPSESIEYQIGDTFQDVSQVNKYLYLFEVNEQDIIESYWFIDLSKHSAPTNQAPTIRLASGVTDETVSYGGVITAPSANDVEVSDNEDAASDLQVEVEIKDESGQTVDSIDTTVPGVYTVTYTVTDTDGASAQVTRTITVQADTVSPKITAVEIFDAASNGDFGTDIGDKLRITFSERIKDTATLLNAADLESLLTFTRSGGENIDGNNFTSQLGGNPEITIVISNNTLTVTLQSGYVDSEIYANDTITFGTLVTQDDIEDLAGNVVNGLESSPITIETYDGQ
jgi:hypothetical protein